MTRERFTPFAWGVFVYSLLVILWGYFLRISESGDGCGTDWPLCHGAVVPAEAHFPTWVEFIHRASSGVVLILVVVLAVWAFRAFPRGHGVRLAAGLALLLTVTESLFGAMLVVFGWVATDISTARIVLRPFHVTNTFALMAALVLVPFWAGRDTRRRPRIQGPGARLAIPAVLGVLALAWTGSWTGLAATAFPTGTLAQGLGQYLSPEHLLIYLRVAHPVLALLVVVLLVRTALRLGEGYRDPAVRTAAWAIGGLAVAQLLVGSVTVLLLNPTWSRLLHLLLADLLWVAVILAGAAVLAEEQAEEGARAEAPESAGRPSVAPYP